MPGPIQWADGKKRAPQPVPPPEPTLKEKVQRIRTDPRHNQEVGKDLRTRLARDDGQRVFEEYKKEQEKVPDFSVHDQSFYDELKTPAEDRRYVVQDLAKEGHVVAFPSPRKTGKTTLLANLGFAGLTGSDFLSAFATDLQVDEGLVVVNAEMIGHDYRDVWEALSPGKVEGRYPYKRLYMMHCRETGTKINLTSDRTREAFAEWLIDRNARWLFLDPWKEFVTWARMDPNLDKDINELLDAVRDLSHLAGLVLTVIPAHTPQSGEAGIRTKGAGAFEDGADAIWKYWRSKDERSAPRLLAAQGRVEGLDPTEVLFDREHYALALGDRTAMDIRAEARQEDRDLKGPVSFRASPTQDLIDSVLETPMTPTQIADLTGLDAQKVKDALRRGRDRRFVPGGNGTWKRP